MNESIKAQFTCLLRPPSSTWKTSSSIPLIYLHLFHCIHLPPSSLQLLKLMSYVSYDFICALVFYLGVRSSSECIRKKNCTIKIILENPSPPQGQHLRLCTQTCDHILSLSAATEKGQSTRWDSVAPAEETLCIKIWTQIAERLKLANCLFGKSAMYSRGRGTWGVWNSEIQTVYFIKLHIK